MSEESRYRIRGFPFKEADAKAPLLGQRAKED